MNFDDATPLPAHHARPRSDIENRKPIKGSKIRGSIFSGNHPNKISVFEDPGPQPKTTIDSGTKTSHKNRDNIENSQFKELEIAVKNLARGNARTLLDIKTLADRVSTTEANFVELKYEVFLSNKPSPFTPAKSRALVHTPTSSPAVCPSITGAEENTTFASPPVPALQRRLLESRAGGRPDGEVKQKSGLRFERSFSFSDERKGIPVEEDYMETLQDDEEFEENTPKGMKDTPKKVHNPARTSDPEVSLEAVSIIKGIGEDVGRAEEYLANREVLGKTCELEPAPTSIGSIIVDPVPEAEAQASARALEDMMAGSLTTSNDSEDRSSVTLEGARPAEVALSDPGDAVDPCSLVIESRSGIVGELGQVEFAGAAEGLGHCTDVGTQTEAKESDLPPVPIMIDSSAQTDPQQALVICQPDPTHMEKLSMRISSLEQQVDISAHYQVTAAFNELAGDYRDLWGEERAKGLNLEAQIELMASKNMVQAAATRLETHTTSNLAGGTKWLSITIVTVIHLLFSAMCILVMRIGGL